MYKTYTHVQLAQLLTIMTNSGDKIIQFKNPPVVEAVFETRFPPNLFVDANRHNYFNLISEEFPTTLFPKAEAGTSPSLQPFRFDSISNDKSIKLSVNTFSFITRNYSTFPEFKAETLRFLYMFAEMFQLDSLRRTGLRYVNHIYIDESDNVDKFLNINFELPLIDKNKIKPFRYELSSPLGEGSVRVLIQQESTEFDSTDLKHTVPLPLLEELGKIKTNRIVLDFDYYIDHGDMNIKNIDHYLAVSHSHTKELFLSLITDEYRASLGEVIGD